MKWITLLLLFASLNTYSQAKKDSFVTANYNIDTLDVLNIYNGLLEITASKYYIPATFSKYYCDLITEEYFEGKLVKKQSLKDSLPSIAWFTLHIGTKLDKNKFPVFFYSRKTDSTTKLFMLVGGAGVHKNLSLRSKGYYSWKTVYDIGSRKHPLRPNEQYPLAVYTSAIGPGDSQYGENIAEFCRISGEVIPVKDWYKDLGIKHFYLFSVRLTTQ